jgi:hypothetical protein
MFAVGVTAGEVDDGPVVVAGALDVLVVVVVVVVEGLLLALLPHAAVNAPAAMIATAPAAAATRPAVNPDVISVRPIVRRQSLDTLRQACRGKRRISLLPVPAVLPAIYRLRRRRVRRRDHVSNDTAARAWFRRSR